MRCYVDRARGTPPLTVGRPLSSTHQVPTTHLVAHWCASEIVLRQFSCYSEQYNEMIIHLHSIVLYSL